VSTTASDAAHACARSAVLAPHTPAAMSRTWRRVGLRASQSATAPFITYAVSAAWQTLRRRRAAASPASTSPQSEDDCMSRGFWEVIPLQPSSGGWDWRQQRGSACRSCAHRHHWATACGSAVGSAPASPTATSSLPWPARRHSAQTVGNAAGPDMGGKCGRRAVVTAVQPYVCSCVKWQATRCRRTNYCLSQ